MKARKQTPCPQEKAMNLNSYVSKGDIQISGRKRKRVSASAIIRKSKLKWCITLSLLRIAFIHVERMEKRKPSNITDSNAQLSGDMVSFQHLNKNFPMTHQCHFGEDNQTIETSILKRCWHCYNHCRAKPYIQNIESTQVSTNNGAGKEKAQHLYNITLFLLHRGGNLGLERWLKG